MISRTETEIGTEATTAATAVAALAPEPRSQSESESETDSNPWSVRGLIRYEEKDLVYADRKMLEAVKMDDPEEQRRHLQDVIELFATKYFVELTVEDLLEDADLDIVYVHRMLVEAADDPEPDLDYEEVKAKYLRRGRSTIRCR